MSYNFISGSIKKSEFYDFLLNTMISAGWKNVTSNSDLDGDVLYSNGKSGEKQIYIQIRPFADNSNSTFSIRDTPVPYMSYRLQPQYTPGATGTAGTVYASLRAWELLPIFNVSYSKANTNYGVTSQNISIDEGVQYYISIDKDKIIMFTKGREEISPYWQFNYIGLPNTIYYRGDNGRGTIGCCQGSIGETGSYLKDSNPHFIMSEYPDSKDGINASSDRHWFSYPKYVLQCKVTPNANNKYFFSEVFFGDDYYGMMGKLDGIYIANSLGLNSGDKVKINNQEYTVFRCDTRANNEGSYYHPHRNSTSSYENMYSRSCFPYLVTEIDRKGAIDTIAVKL